MLVAWIDTQRKRGANPDLSCVVCSGDVVSEETYQKCIKPDGEFKGKKVGPKDIIRVKNGGTGFAARDGEKAQVKKHFALGECHTGSGPAGFWFGCMHSMQKCSVACVTWYPCSPGGSLLWRVRATGAWRLSMRWWWC